jgi:hypothetical protein
MAMLMTIPFLRTVEITRVNVNDLQQRGAS